MAGRGENVTTACAVALAVGALAFLHQVAPVDATLAHLRGATTAAGHWGPALFVIGFAFALVVALPATPFSLAAGLLFGPVAGVAYAWAGSCLGTTAAFALARLGRRPVRDLLARRSRRLLRFLDDHSFGAVFTLRVLMLPFGLTSYALGLAGVQWRAFLSGTAAGAVPPVVVFVLIGAAVGDWTLLLQPAFVVPLVLAALATFAAAWAFARRRDAGAALAAPSALRPAATADREP